MQTFEKNYKNYKLLEILFSDKKNYDTASIITLHCVRIVILYSAICNQISHCDMIHTSGSIR